jgi:hypothetical protein
MKRLSLLVVSTLIAFTSPVLGAGKHDHAPRHGGVVVDVKDVDYELVAKPEVIHLYVRDHGKPVELKGASAKLTLLNGNEKSEVELTPAGDKFEARGRFAVASGTRVVATVTLAGRKPVPVRFTVK